MKTDTLTQTLEVGHRILDLLRQSDDGYENGEVAKLMHNVYSLGREISTSPELLSNVAVRRFVDETASVLKKQDVDLSYYPLTVLLRFEGNWEDGQWEQLCVARSGLQFFIDLFRETAIAEKVSFIDTSDIDELIRERGNEGNLSDDEIPPGIPLSHWWWWYPEEPRPRR